MAGILRLLHALNRSETPQDWTGWLFPLLTLGAGFIGGAQFPLANRLVLQNSGHLGRVAGFLYAFDLAGSSVGAILTSAIFIPILGIYPTLFLLSILNLSCLVLLDFGRIVTGLE
jgi:spermidine synthase